MTDKLDNKNQEELYPIRTVSSLTGVQTVTLRAWERRYHLIKPLRTDTGHRLYSREDVEKIRKASGLLEKGMNISQAAQILNDPDFSASFPTDMTAVWMSYQQQTLEATRVFDERELENIYQRALSLYPVETVTRRLIVPVLETLGKKWDKTPAGIAAEHFFSVFLRHKLGARFHHRSHNNNGPKLICACLPGDHHETGLLLFALAADESNYRQILLGADMPIEHLAEAAKLSSVDAIVLSGKCTTDPEQIVTAFKKLVAAADVPVFAGGDASVGLEERLLETGAVCLGSEIDKGINTLNRLLKNKTADSSNER